MPPTVKLTEYSHGSGCGSKIAPELIGEILQTQLPNSPEPRLLVGSDTRDDAAVYDLGDGSSIISTTDSFMPIVDDPCEFGRIAATNAISDIHTMGGTPLLAVAIVGWPIDQTSGGLLVAVDPTGEAPFLEATEQQSLDLQPTGELLDTPGDHLIEVA